jgi:endogenous inhibitor of DNA gyrase (YacG/DUF329 family)
MAPVRCPICDKLFEPDQTEAMPFCSPRCRQIDLGRWLDEKYGLPYESEDEPDPVQRPPREPED